MDRLQQIPWARSISAGAMALVGLLLTVSAVEANEVDEAEEAEHDLTPRPTVVLPAVPAPQLNLKQFRRGKCGVNQPGVSDRTINRSGTTIPSLWWTQDLLQSKPQFNPKLIEGWLVCGAALQDANARVCGVISQGSLVANADPTKQVKMLVNTQLWTLLDYVDRYEFLYRFGTATSECGYNIYVFNTDAVLLADYTCDFRRIGPNLKCVLRPSVSGSSGLKRGPTDAFSATDYRIDVF